MENASNVDPTVAATVPQRLADVENVVNRAVDILEKFAPYVSMIPGLAVPVKMAEGVGHAVETVIDLVQGDLGEIDSAALAANAIVQSTGNDKLDARLIMIEHAVQMVFAMYPVIKELAKDMGYNLPDFAVPEAGA